MRWNNPRFASEVAEEILNLNLLLTEHSEQLDTIQESATIAEILRCRHDLALIRAFNLLGVINIP